MRRLLFLLAGLACLHPVRGAAPAPSTAAGEERPASTDYVLQPLDLLQVRVFQEPTLDRDVRITRDYLITLPLIGTVDLRDRTLHDAETMIRDLYNRDFLVNPQVSITVLEYARRSVNVLGSVTTPGEILFPPEEGLSLLDAISRAGGFSRLADRRRVKLTRNRADGTTETFIINVDELIEGSSQRTWSLQVNDLIYVPERLL